MALLLWGALFALGGRLVDLQVVQHDRLQQLAAENTVRKIERKPMRGQIFDSHHVPLATSQPAKVICADPTLIGNWRQPVAQMLAPLLGMDEAQITERLVPRLHEEDGKTNISKYVVLKRKVSLDTWDKIQQGMASLHAVCPESKLSKQDQAFFRNLRSKAVFAEDDQVRVYPGQRLASQVLGYVSGDDAQTGLSGLEKSFNTSLSGIAGWRITEMDKRQHEIVAFRDQDVAPRDGLNVVTTLDAGLQNIVESELAIGMDKHHPISISSIMVRPRTGEILAMATLPDFDPNHPGASPLDALRNRVISDIAEPGSTFKIVVVTGGLNEHAVTLNDAFDCEHGHFFYAGRTLHDHEAYGVLTVENIITKSSNIGAAKIGIRLGQDELYEYIHNFGFGERTGIPLPDEAAGLVHPVKDWSKVSIAQIPMGQGIAVTPLQMVMAMSAIANDGVLMRPMLVNHLEDGDGKIIAQYQPESVRHVAGLPAIHDIITALKTVPTRDGTAVAAHLDHYTVAGKTGTAQKVEHGQYVQKFFTSFIGFFPADNPELCISVVMDDPKDGHYGGLLAAPIFHAIAERAANYLNLKPDIESESPPSQTLTRNN
ncbi:MAG TPA: penicillin-binding protein 2 [Verrucomicrobiae bacterium]|jgi:cell division protein FtsI/penicillin-binding protein 2|nr:penicillin-binding protein 2 [Verrucomicrobiae bacterium]